MNRISLSTCVELLLLDELVEELLVEDETIVVLLTLLVLLLITLLSLLVVEEEVDDVISPFPWQLTSEKSITLKTKIFFFIIYFPLVKDIKIIITLYASFNFISMFATKYSYNFNSIKIFINCY